MPTPPLEALRQAIRDLHGCDSRWAGSRSVAEAHPGGTTWSGEVQVFTLIDHPAATRAYAWPNPTDEGGVQYMAVLHEGSVDSAGAAVRAALGAEWKERGSE